MTDDSTQTGGSVEDVCLCQHPADDHHPQCACGCFSFMSIADFEVIE
jgi:hypothetical protein